jgi:hypothetical protein
MTDLGMVEPRFNVLTAAVVVRIAMVALALGTGAGEAVEFWNDRVCMTRRWREPDSNLWFLTRQNRTSPAHLVDQVDEPKPAAEDSKSSTTENGLSIEEQVRKKWDPKKGSLPIV